MDWARAFLPASFRGVPFRVEGESGSGGRRVVIHDLIGGEAPVTEDMGAAARRYQVTAYVAGSLASANALALTVALQAAGPGLLILPLQGPRSVRVESWSIDRSKDRNGFVGLSIDFVPAGAGLGFGLVPGPVLVAARFLAGVAVVASLAEAGLGALRGPGRAAEVRAAEGAAVTIEALRVDAGLSGAATTRIAAAASDLAADAETILTDGAAFLVRAGETLRDLAREADADAGRIFRLHALAAASDATATGRAMAGFLAAAAALATVRGGYAVRQDAMAARADLSAAVSPILGSIGVLGYEAEDWLSGLTGDAITALSREAADRAPLVRVETGVSLPATVLAWRLYGDPARAADLVARNRVATPCLMPAAFEAAAPG
jgi:hypothetical protein